MVHGGNAALGVCVAQHRVYIEATVAYPPVHELGYAEDIEVPMKGGHLAAWNQQQMIEERLQLAHLIILRVCVVVGDGDEVQTARSRCLHGEKEGAWHLTAALALAAAITVASVHMEIAPIPTCANGERLRGEARIFCARVEAYLRPVV